MSASTSSYSNLLGGMWAPEGSEINDRLRRLQELENMRKEREAKRLDILKNTGQATTGVITRTPRTRAPISSVAAEVKVVTNEPFSLSSGLGLRRAMSLREDTENKENYGGARPKNGGFTKDTNQDSNNWSLFSDVTTSLMGPRRTMRSDRDYSTANRTRFDSTDSEDSTTTSSSSRSKVGLSDRPGYSGYSRTTSQPQDGESSSLFSGVSNSLSKPRTTSYERQTYDRDNGGFRTNGGNFEDEITEEVEYTETTNENNTNGHFEQNGHEQYHDDDDEEPLHFIERLKNGGSRRNSFGNNNSFVFGSIPTVPPLQHNSSDGEVEQAEDIVSIAKDISYAFGTEAKSPTSTKFSSETHTVENPNASMAYDIVQVDYDSSGDEEGKRLPIQKNIRMSEWGVVDQGPGDLDEMQAFFTGREVDYDPNISRVLDGEKIRSEFDKSFSSVSDTPVKERPKASEAETEKDTSVKKKVKPKIAAKPTKRGSTPVNRLKNTSNGTGRSSGSENDSKPNSESDGETLVERKPRTGTSPNKSSPPANKPSPPANKPSPPARNDRSNSITEKLTKLEAMTSEKTRRKSQGETDLKKSVPSYMSGTRSSKTKYSRVQDATSPKPYSRDLKKDVRELREFVRENSVPNSPVATSEVQSMIVEIEPIPKPEMKEMSVQTDMMFTIDNDYVCKHCGKSSAEDVSTMLTEKNIEMTIGSAKGSDKSKNSEHNFSSKDSVKSLGELSSKSDKTHVKPKTTSSSTASYMKGTTASRLKTGNENSNGKLISPENMLYPDGNTGTTKARGTAKYGVGQKAKGFESKEKVKPALSLFRATSLERTRQLELDNKRSKLSKSKSVEQVHLMQNVSKKSNNTNLLRDTRTSKAKAKAVTSIDLNALHSPRAAAKSKRFASPRSAPTSPRRKGLLDIDIEPVESKGQFTTIVDNPFIKNDSSGRHSSKSSESGESVWTKAKENRSPSGSRSESAGENDKVSVGTSSAGEGRSLSHLSWSDSGSTESLNKSKSESRGSNTSLNDKTVFDEPRSRKTSSSSTTSHNAVLNLLSPTDEPQKGNTEALETDIDAVYMSNLKGKKTRTNSEEHNEETVERAHLEFAKKACNMLEVECKKRDSSNESSGQKDIVNGSTNGVNGTETEAVVKKGNTKGPQKKGKKGFLKGKGKLFKK